MEMRSPDAPFLEFSFYFANTPDADAFKQLTTSLLSLGGKLTGNAYAFKGDSMRRRSFEGIYDHPLTNLKLNAQSLNTYLTLPDTRVIQIEIEGASNVVRNVAEILTYVRVSQKASAIDQHPLSLWTEGELFCDTFTSDSRTDRRMQSLAKSAGIRAYKRFHTLVSLLNPTYAAITVERDIECLTDLVSRPSSFSFRNFYISKDYFEYNKIAFIQQLYAGAYIEEAGRGVYYSCTSQLNPNRIQCDVALSYEMSRQVSRILTS